MTLKLNGSTDGSVSIDAPADTSPTGSDITLTLPTTVGSANQFVKNGGTAGELEYSSMVEDSSGDVGLGISAPTWTSGGGLHLGDNHGIGFGDGGNGRPSFQLITTDGSQLDLRCGFGSDDADVSIDTSGRLLINTGTDGPITTASGANLQVRATSEAPQIILGRNDSTATTGETLGILSWYGNDGGSYQECASIRAVCDANHANNDKPTSLQFFTCPDNSATLAQRFRIRTDGLSEFDSSSHVLSATTSVGAGTAKYIYRGHHSSGSTIVFNVWSNGNVESATNSYTGISDVKLKENIVDANSQWDDLKAIQVRNYNFKESTGQQTHTQLGVVAQEVETVSPGLVFETPDVDNDGNDLGTVTKAVNYSVLYMKAVKALQEAMTRIETLEAKVTALEAAE